MISCDAYHENNSMNVVTILVLVVLWATTHWLLSRLQWRLKRAPPGPLPLPLVGNIFSLGKKPHISLAKLAQSHGPLMFLQLGFLNTVVASSPDVARQILQSKDASFSNRFVGDSLRAFHHNDHGIAVLPVGDRWRTLRKIMTVQLMTSRSLDAYKEIRMEKSRDMISHISGCSRSGVAVNISQLAFDMALNSLSRIFFSVDMTADTDSNLGREMKETISELMFEVGRPNMADLFPALRFMDPQGIRRRTEIHFRKLYDLFDGIVEKRLAERDQGLPEHGDVLDSLLKICKEKSQHFQLSQIPRFLLELFGGPESVSSTIEWAMAELLRNPSKMKKAKAELDQVIGKGNFVQESDITRLPYLKAALNETFRLHPPVVFLIPRQADADTEVSGFVVPKGSQVLVNLWAIGRDPAVWSHPCSFEPERFLGSDIDVKGQHFELIPFGAGRRNCAGMNMALKMVHVMLASMIHFFEWSLEDGVEPENLDMDEKFGVGLHRANPLYAIPILTKENKCDNRTI